MFCARCGNRLEEEQVCVQCGWSIGEIEMPIEQPKRGGGASIASLVCGILGLAFCGGFFILPLIGLGLGFAGLKSKESETAVVGIILNAIVLVLSVLFFGLFLALWVANANPTPPSLFVPTGRCC